MSTKRITGTILAIIGIITIIAALVVALGGQELAGDILPSANGKEITCNAAVSASLLSGHLKFSSASCTTGGSCIVNPLRSLWIGDVSGKMILVADTNEYASVDVKENRAEISSDNYQLTGCIPKTATQAKIQLKNDNGGVDDEKPFTV